jgi:hypothetical protein
MLKELSCDKFRDKTITFHKGLNVILGDDLASNSIGKSTLLMILDFIYGGTTYTKRPEVVQNIGHHEFKFCFDFPGERLYFIRKTEEDDKVFCCDSKYNVTNEMDIKEYLVLLKNKYKIELSFISFRAITSPFSRVWGKGNIDLKKPFHQTPVQRNKEVVLNIVKLFGKYEGISDIEDRLRGLSGKKSIVTAAIKEEYLPSLTKRDFTNNNKNIADLKRQIYVLKSDVLGFSNDLKDLVTRDILDLKMEKSRLVKQRDVLENRLTRTRNNISLKYLSDKKQFQKLVEYFPNVNIGKIVDIDKFHNSIANILKNELKGIEKELLTSISILEEDIKKIDVSIEEKLDIKDTPSYTVEKIVELSTLVKQMEYENSFYEKQQKVSEDIKKYKKDLTGIKGEVVDEIEQVINEKILELNERINPSGRRPPVVELKEDTYTFYGPDDTGTGKAYTNLLTLDLAIFRLTPVPILIHDSLLFKNIETGVIENIVDLYYEESKQVFIAIDEIRKYQKKTQEILTAKSVIRLTASKTLFIKDWKTN